MYELHFFTVKLIITFSSSALVFSIGMLGLVDEEHQFKIQGAILFGWVLVFLSIVLIFVALYKGLDLTYDYYNNRISGKAEIDESTSLKETLIHKYITYSAGASGLGVISVLIFASYNFLK